MKFIVHLTLVFSVMLSSTLTVWAASEIHNHESDFDISAKVKFARVKYEEEISILPINSDWDSELFAVQFGIGNNDQEGFEWGADFEFFVSGEASEDFVQVTGGGTFASNEMELEGIGLNLRLGHVLINNENLKFDLFDLLYPLH